MAHTHLTCPPHRPNFWNKKAPSGDLPHNINTRKGIGMEEMSRTQTMWGPFGEMQLPPHYWSEYAKLTTQRRLDMIDILHASAARDAVSKDTNFGEFEIISLAII